MMSLRWTAIAVSPLLTFVSLSYHPAQAEGIVPATDTGTEVTSSGPDHTITGGTTSADSQNLFHTFTEFNLLTGESATFITDPAILNILSGINGGNPSVIDGLLQVSGSNANLFLINPNGILFGPNAALNLQGSFTATTADQVEFVTGEFELVNSADYAALVGEPQSFRFSLEQPGSIVNAGQLAVSSGESVVLVGG
ncbi:MAG: filamentous hemagglutinin N-terminal domain-containing protein, partial [Cyanobacteria bacterium P01_H01_bin.152]